MFSEGQGHHPAASSDQWLGLGHLCAAQDRVGPSLLGRFRAPSDVAQVLSWGSGPHRTTGH